MTTIVLIISALGALLLAQFVYYVAVYHGERRQAELKRRLQSMTSATDEQGVVRERRIAHSPFMARVLGDWPLAQRLEERILQTDLDWTVAGMVLWSLSLAAATLAVIWWATGSILLAIACSVTALSIPLLVLFNARVRRDIKLSGQLPDALDMMVRSLRAGHGVAAAMRLVAEEMPLPVAMEFGRCYQEQRLGVALKDAVRNMANRVPRNHDIKIFAVSLIIQHDTGGNLVEILDNIATTIRERFKFYGKLRALTVEAKMSGVILSVLPFVSAILVVVFNPSYLQPLVSDPIGRALLAIGFVLWTLGVVWMRRLARVDY